MREQVANQAPDRRLAELAARNHGVLTSTQLIAAGLSSSGIERRVRAGRLHPIHRGVYAVGHARVSQHGRWLAAVLAAGPKAALSHQSAAELWALLPAKPGPTHVTVPGTGGRQRRTGVVIHRSTRLTAIEIT